MMLHTDYMLRFREYNDSELFLSCSTGELKLIKCRTGAQNKEINEIRCDVSINSEEITINTNCTKLQSWGTLGVMMIL